MDGGSVTFFSTVISSWGDKSITLHQLCAVPSWLSIKLSGVDSIKARSWLQCCCKSDLEPGDVVCRMKKEGSGGELQVRATLGC